MLNYNPYASQLASLSDDIEMQAIAAEERIRNAIVAPVSIRNTPLSSQAMKQIYGNDGTVINDASVDMKLAKWSASYREQKLLPKKYAPMLYIHDLYNGKGDWHEQRRKFRIGKCDGPQSERQKQRENTRSFGGGVA